MEEKATIIAVVNQKGGTGKTTTTVNLGAALAKLGKRVLLVDLDSQGNLTFSFGVHEYETTVAHALAGEAKLKDILHERENLHIAPSDISISSLEVSLANTENREHLLKDVLDEVSNEYDYILLDCGPSLSVITVNALSAASKIIVPMQMEVLSLHGLSLIIDTVFNVKETYNPDLSILGILPVMMDKRRSITGEIYDYLKSNYGFRILKNNIGTDVRIVEAPSFGKSVVNYSPYSVGGLAYTRLAEEIEQIISSSEE